MSDKKKLLITAKRLRDVYAKKAVASYGCPDIQTKHKILKRRLEILNLAHNSPDDPEEIKALIRRFEEELEQISQ